MEEAVAKQQDLLAEFEKIADELNRVLANLEGSTLVKRLKAASRLQYRIGGRLGEGAQFGRRVASKAIPADDARYAVERIVRAYKSERRADMSFGEWADLQGDARLTALIGVGVAREAEEVAA